MAKRPRLTQSAWIEIGFDTLTAEGPGALRAEYLCRIAGTTKGSFYWHFSDIEAFRDAVLDQWATLAVDEARGLAATQTDRIDDLRHYGSTAAFWADPACAEAWAEPAIRGWSYYDSAAQIAVARADEARFEALRKLLARFNLNNPDFATLYLAMANQNAGKGPGADAETARVLGTLTDLVALLE